MPYIIKSGNAVTAVVLDDQRQVSIENLLEEPEEIQKIVLRTIAEEDRPALKDIYGRYPNIAAVEEKIGPQIAPFDATLDPKRAVITSPEEFQAALAACYTLKENNDFVIDVDRRAALLQRAVEYDEEGLIIGARWLALNNSGNIVFTVPMDFEKISPAYLEALQKEDFTVEDQQIIFNQVPVLYTTATNDILPYGQVGDFRMERSRDKGATQIGTQLIGGIPIQENTKHKPADSSEETARKRRQIGLDQLSHKIGLMLHQLMPVEIQVAVLRKTAERLGETRMNSYREMGEAERQLFTKPATELPKAKSPEEQQLLGNPLLAPILDARRRLDNPSEPYSYADLIWLIRDQRFVQSFGFSPEVNATIEEAAFFCEVTQSIGQEGSDIVPIAHASADFTFLLRCVPATAVLDQLKPLLLQPAFAALTKAAADPAALTYGAVGGLGLTLSDSFAYHLVFAEFPKLFSAMTQFRGTELSVKSGSNMDSLQYTQSFFTHEFPVRLSELYQGLVARQENSEINQHMFIGIMRASARANIQQMIEALSKDRFNTLPFAKTLQEQNTTEDRLEMIKRNAIFLWKEYIPMGFSTFLAEASRLHIPEEFLHNMDEKMAELWDSMKPEVEKIVLAKFNNTPRDVLFKPDDRPVNAAAAAAAPRPAQKKELISNIVLGLGARKR